MSTCHTFTSKRPFYAHKTHIWLSIGLSVQQHGERTVELKKGRVNNKGVVLTLYCFS